MIHLRETFYKILYQFEGTYTSRILSNFWDLVCKVGPYFIISVVIGVCLTRFFPKKKILLDTRYEALSIFFAGIVGLVSPFPIYIAVPIGLSFLSVGIPLSVVIAFVVASPLMNPSIFYLTYSLLGMKMAMARVISALLIGLGAGFLSRVILRSLKIQSEQKEKYEFIQNRTIVKEFVHYFRYMIKFFLIAIFLSAAVKAFVSPELIANLLGGQSKTSILIAIAMGVPFYNCGGAAIPIIETLMDMGMNKGAALAFFISGPATKLETLYIFKSLLGIHVLIFYLILIFTASFLYGFIFTYF